MGLKMTRFIVSILANLAGLWLASYFVNDFLVNGGIKEYLIIGVVLAILNLVVKPIIKLITAPLIIITLGLFSIVINAVLLLTTDYLFNFFTIETIEALFWGTIIIGVLNVLGGITNKIAT